MGYVDGSYWVFNFWMKFDRPSLRLREYFSSYYYWLYWVGMALGWMIDWFWDLFCLKVGWCAFPLPFYFVGQLFPRALHQSVGCSPGRWSRWTGTVYKVSIGGLKSWLHPPLFRILCIVSYDPIYSRSFWSNSAKRLVPHRAAWASAVSIAPKLVSAPEAVTTKPHGRLLRGVVADNEHGIHFLCPLAAPSNSPSLNQVRRLLLESHRRRQPSSLGELHQFPPFWRQIGQIGPL